MLEQLKALLGQRYQLEVLVVDDSHLMAPRS